MESIYVVATSWESGRTLLGASTEKEAAERIAEDYIQMLLECGFVITKIEKRNKVTSAAPCPENFYRRWFISPNTDKLKAEGEPSEIVEIWYTLGERFNGTNPHEEKE